MASRPTVRMGRLYVDVVDFNGALTRIGDLVAAGAGGYVVTPNVDHLCLAEDDPELVAAYESASLSLLDGVPLLWLARLIGQPLPGKISGSDLLLPLLRRAAEQGWRVYFLGGAPGIGARAAEILRQQLPSLQVVGMDAPSLGFERDPAAQAAVLAQIAVARPQLLLVALGCPKQEKWMFQARAGYAPAVALGIGASLDFIAGKVRRAPAWMSRVGLEWLYRLLQEPRRMASRYLVRDRAIVGIAWRAWRQRQRP